MPLYSLHGTGPPEALPARPSPESRSEGPAPAGFKVGDALRAWLAPDEAAAYRSFREVVAPHEPCGSDAVHSPRAMHSPHSLYTPEALPPSEAPEAFTALAESVAPYLLHAQHSPYAPDAPQPFGSSHAPFVCPAPDACGSRPAKETCCGGFSSPCHPQALSGRFRLLYASRFRGNIAPGTGSVSEDAAGDCLPHPDASAGKADFIGTCR